MSSFTSVKTRIGIIKRKKLIIKTSHSGKPLITFELSELSSMAMNPVELEVKFPLICFIKKHLTFKIKFVKVEN